MRGQVFSAVEQQNAILPVVRVSEQRQKARRIACGNSLAHKKTKKVEIARIFLICALDYTRLIFG